MAINKDAPHKAVVLIRAEVMEVFHDGRVTNLPVAIESKVITISGISYDDCMEKVKEFFKEMKNG
jgi:hypothetical protein